MPYTMRRVSFPDATPDNGNYEDSGDINKNDEETAWGKCPDSHDTLDTSSCTLAGTTERSVSDSALSETGQDCTGTRPEWRHESTDGINASCSSSNINGSFNNGDFYSNESVVETRKDPALSRCLWILASIMMCILMGTGTLLLLSMLSKWNN
jgi:hypothetical protein